MNQTIEKILYFLDWRNDLDLTYVPKNFVAVIDTATLRLSRPIIRGGIEGAILGTTITSLYTMITGEFSPEAAKVGALFGGFGGALVDLVQYGTRWDRYFSARD